MGATAIGTGINSPPVMPSYARNASRNQRPARNAAGDLVEATQDSGEFALISSVMKTAAVQTFQNLQQDTAPGFHPVHRCGLYEIRLPAMQPGSSIMPGKVNPVIPEVVSQVCFQIIGTRRRYLHGLAKASELELNMAEPIIAFNLLFGLNTPAQRCHYPQHRCIAGIEGQPRTLSSLCAKFHRSVHCPQPGARLRTRARLSQRKPCHQP